MPRRYFFTTSVLLIAQLFFSCKSAVLQIKKLRPTIKASTKINLKKLLFTNRINACPNPIQQLSQIDLPNFGFDKVLYSDDPEEAQGIFKVGKHSFESEDLVEMNAFK